MKSKKLLLVTLLLLCLLTMSAVSATNNNNTLASDTNGDLTTTSDTSTNGGDNDNSKTILRNNEKQNTLSNSEETDYNADINTNYEVSTNESEKDAVADVTIAKDDSKTKNFTITKIGNEGQILLNQELTNADDDDEEHKNYKIPFHDIKNQINNNDLIKFALTDSYGTQLYCKLYGIEKDDDTIRFNELRVSIWDKNDERGILYSDAKGFVVGVDIPKSLLDGTITVFINDIKTVTFNPYEDEEDYGDDFDSIWRDWELKQLDISKAGNYNIIVKYNDEVIANKTLNVQEFHEDVFRARLNYEEETLELFCPNSFSGNVTIITTTWNETEEKDDQINIENYEITNDDFGKWKTWSLYDLGFKPNGAYYNFKLNITNNDEEVYRYVNGHSDYGLIDEPHFPGLLDHDNDEYKEFDSNETVTVSYLYLPKDYDGEALNITVLKNDDIFYENNTESMTKEYDEIKEAYKYPIILNLTQLKDGDLLRFIFNDDEWPYAIEINDEGKVRFWDDPEDDDDDEELHGEGTEIEYAELKDKVEVNTGGIIASIPINSLVEDVNDEFEVIIVAWESIERTKLNLSNITNTGENYLIKFSDLSDETKELVSREDFCDYDTIIQFFKDEDPSKYVEGHIYFYNNPYIVKEHTLSIIMNDTIITLFGLPECASDKFTVISSKDGSDPITKVFNITELKNEVDQIRDEDTGECFIEEYYLLNVGDLGITEHGEYNITIKFQIEDSIKEYSGIVHINQLNIDAYHNEEDEPFNDITQTVFGILLPEDSSGKLVKLFVGDYCVNEKNISDMEYSNHHGSKYRVMLNYFEIVNSGNYTVRIEVYNDTDGTILLGDASNDIEVIVEANEITFKDTAYDIFNDGGYIEPKFGTPLTEGEYYIVALNGTDAIKYTPNMEIIDTSFFDIYLDNEDFDIKNYVLKPGNYSIKIFNATDNNRIQIDEGTFEIIAKSETVTLDYKTEILNGEPLTITINTPEPKEEDLLRIYDMESNGTSIILHNLIELMGYEELPWDNGKIIVNITDLKCGEHNLFIAYGGDFLWEINPRIDNFYRESIKVTSLLTNTTLSITNTTDSIVITLTTKDDNTPISGATIKYNITGQDTEQTAITLSDGTVTIPNLEGTGNITITVTYNGNDTYNKTSNTAKYNFPAVTPPIVKIDPNFDIIISNVEEGNPITVKVTANETFTGNVEVKIAGPINKTVTVKLENGIGNETVTILTSGEYTATINFANNDTFNDENKTINFNITKKITPINPDQEGNNTNPDPSGNPQGTQNQGTNGSTTTPTTKLDEKAQEKLEQKYPAKQISITSKKTITVSKKAKKLILKATLKVKGKKVNKRTVKFIIKGKTYKAKTNKKGVATLKLSKKQLQKILKNVKSGKTINYKIRYGKKTVKKLLKVKK